MNAIISLLGSALVWSSAADKEPYYMQPLAGVGVTLIQDRYTIDGDIFRRKGAYFVLGLPMKFKQLKDTRMVDVDFRFSPEIFFHPDYFGTQLPLGVEFLHQTRLTRSPFSIFWGLQAGPYLAFLVNKDAFRKAGGGDLTFVDRLGYGIVAGAYFGPQWMFDKYGFRIHFAPRVLCGRIPQYTFGNDGSNSLSLLFHTYVQILFR